MNTLAILGRVHRHLSAVHGAPLPYEMSEAKRMVVIGIATEMTGASISHMASLTCETPENVSALYKQWRGLDESLKRHWRAVVTAS